MTPHVTIMAEHIAAQAQNEASFSRDEAN